MRRTAELSGGLLYHNFAIILYIAPAWHGCLDEVRLQETPISGDELVETVVANIRLGGVCKYFRDVFSKKPAA